MVEYDIVKDLYKLEYVADREMHFMTFEDVHAASYLGIGIKSIQVAPLLSEKFTESGDYKMCCKALDSSEWLKAMIKEIQELEKMC